jgi:sarcosine oxidase
MADSYEYVVVGLGALGSAAAYHLARRGEQVLGLEQFALGHVQGASHDSSRILRHSYHTPGYVTLTFDAYDDWAALEADSGEQLVTVVGGLDLFPPDPAIPMTDYTASMAACGVPFDELDRDQVAQRWPQLSLPEGTVAVHQPRAAIVPAARGTSVLQQRAREHGAELRDQSPVTAIRDLGADGIEVEAGGRTYRCRRLVVCADAWTNQVLAGIGHQVPLTVTLEQVTYFRPERPERFAPDLLPLWLWMDDPCYYGFPCYGEDTVKAAQDCGGPEVTADQRSYDPDPAMQRRLAEFMARTLPGSGPPVRSVRCLYTLVPDRDFVLGPVPGHEAVLVGMGAAHGFKFAPTFGRLLAELAVEDATDADVEPFRLDRPALTDASYSTHWLV